MIIPAYADWPSDCNELGIGEILGIDCNKEKEPRTIFLFKGTNPSDWIDECNELGIERVNKIWENEGSSEDILTCLTILNLNLTERQLGIIGKEMQWGKMISTIEDKFIENLSPQLHDCVEIMPDLAVFEGGASLGNSGYVNLPHWGFGLMLKQSCTTTGEESEIRGYYDFLQEKIVFKKGEISKMKIIIPSSYFEDILNASGGGTTNFLGDDGKFIAEVYSEREGDYAYVSTEQDPMRIIYVISMSGAIGFAAIFVLLWKKGIIFT